MRKVFLVEIEFWPDFAEDPAPKITEVVQAEVEKELMSLSVEALSLKVAKVTAVTELKV